MSKKTNPTLIGIFVIGAVALIVAGVLIFGSGKFLQKRYPYVMFFEGSIKGLSVGAPVVFRGVEIGSVTDIVMEFDATDMTVMIPVFIETEPEKIKRVGGEMDPDPQKNIPMLIEKGLRAKLEMQSLITGQLMIALDFHPDRPLRLVGKDMKVPEIPTIPTTLQALSKTIEELNLKDIATDIKRIVDAVENVVSAPEVMESIRSLNQALKDVQKLVKNVDEQVKPLATSIKGTFDDTQKLVNNVDDQVKPLVDSIKEASNAAQVTFDQATKALSLVDGVIAEDSAPYYELVNTLEEMSAAARSLRILADYLERHPEALIQGKGGSKGR